MEMKQLIVDLLSAIENLEKYMLDGNKILLQPEYIFRDRQLYYFCYYPAHQENAKEAFHQLMEFLVVKVDERDDKGVRFAYTFHKATMDEHYSIAEILQRFEPEVTYNQEEIIEGIEGFQIVEIEEELEEEKEGRLWSRIKTFFQEWFLHQDDDDDL